MTFSALRISHGQAGIVPSCLRSINGPFSTLAPDLDPGSVTRRKKPTQYLSRTVFVAPESNWAPTRGAFLCT